MDAAEYYWLSLLTARTKSKPSIHILPLCRSTLLAGFEIAIPFGPFGYEEICRTICRSPLWKHEQMATSDVPPPLGERGSPVPRDSTTVVAVIQASSMVLAKFILVGLPSTIIGGLILWLCEA
jgi:hypothetical protein